MSHLTRYNPWFKSLDNPSNIARRRRRSRFRTTADPTLRLIAKATFTPSPSIRTKLTRRDPLRPRALGRENWANWRRVRTRPGTNLDRQLVTALVTTGLQDRAPSAGAHARPKTMGLSPLSLIWLIRTLHRNLISHGVVMRRDGSWSFANATWGQSYPTTESAPARS